MRFSYWFILITIVFSVSISITGYFYFPLFKFEGFDKALEGILLLASISLGFYGACLSVLASIFNTKIVKEVMNDNNYRSEFILIAAFSLSSGFVLVVTTIIYQVLLENGNVAFIIMNTINTLWLFLLFVFLAFSLLFILTSFIIFFHNKEEQEESQINPGEITNSNF